MNFEFSNSHYKLWGHIEYYAMARGWQINGFEFSNLHSRQRVVGIFESYE